nr:SMP-30/gluconolactonase/LRE family protein [Luteimonas sp. Y-2-2-4F]
MGEGVAWCERRQALLWVDILGRALWAHRPSDGLTRRWPLPERLGCLAPCDDDRLLVALEKRLALVRIDLDGDAAPGIEALAPVQPDLLHVRSNDGRCDRSGHFVFGTRHEGAPSTPPDGAFFQFSMRHGLRRLPLPAAAIPNSIAFSPDGTRLYFCDSVRPAILVADYDALAARVEGVRVFAELPAGAEPDGATVDRDGALWSAHWGAGRVVRYAPDGRIDRIVRVAAPQVSCCAIGGAGLDTLYATSARVDLGAAALRAAPGSGGVFAFALGRPLGLPEARFRTAA